MGLSHSSFDYLRGLLRDRAAIVLGGDKEYLALARLADVARQQGLATVEELMARLRREAAGPLHQRVVEAMATNETSFFRDRHPFAALRAHILPELARRRSAERSLTIWSAACSTGQEPYSVALLIREALPHLLTWRLTLLATDLSAEALERGRGGAYTGTEVARGLTPDLLAKYFAARGTAWVIHDEVRRMVQWRQVNLAAGWPALPPVDVLLLRNVLIYLDQAARQEILRRARAALRPDGYLILGGAESALGLGEAFVAEQHEQTTFYRVADGVKSTGRASLTRPAGRE